MDRTARKHVARNKRKLRIRSGLTGTSERPRMCIFRSLKHMYCQIIDDHAGRTLAASSTLELAKRGDAPKSGGNRDAAGKVGKDIAAKAKEAGITKVVFDRGPYKFHGRVKALAESAREGGLSF